MVLNSCAQVCVWILRLVICLLPIVVALVVCNSGKAEMGWFSGDASEARLRVTEVGQAGT